MKSIKPLPQAVHNTVLSGIILFDLTRVVEELIFNSLDAGAKKVSVFIGVGTCYVKVVDDGSGISRDGLVLLGERYATSKLHRLADMDAASGSFGFRGEALASISDVSLLEILTKAFGRPNGYRKVMKGSKCLHLGIDDDRKDVGTTVVVRDLFYNQPVRRKYMQSSPKKVLHSVKKCVYRIALAHSKISFEVVDIESEDELFCTHPSSSPLSLLRSGFGIEDSSSLHELSISDGLLKLSGYISGPCDSVAIKAFQYVYINSRFVCKGPIHKLLNHLAAGFECLDPWKANNGSQKGKRSRSQACPAYIVNLCCPQSLYDLTFEPSKTYVEFKDWVPIITFIEKAIQNLWRESTTHGESSSHAADILRIGEMWKEGDNITSVRQDFFDVDLSENSKFAIEKCGIQKHQPLLHLPTSPLKMLTKEGDHLIHGEHERDPFWECLKNTAGFTEQQTEMEFIRQSNHTFQSWDGSLAKCIPGVTHESDNHLWTSDNNLHVEPCLSNRKAGSALTFDCHKFNNEFEVIKDFKKSFLQSCSSQGSLPVDSALFTSKELFELPIDGFRSKRNRVCLDEMVNILEVDVSKQSFDFCSRTLSQDEESSAQRFHRLIRKGEVSRDFDPLSRASVKSFPSHGETFAEENGHPLDSQMRDSGSCHESPNSEWCSATSDFLFQATPWDVEHFTNKKALERSSRSGKATKYGHVADTEEKDYKFCYNIMSKSSSLENWISSCTYSGLDFEHYADSSKDFCKFPRGHNSHNKFAPGRSDTVIDETDLLCLDLCGKDYADIDTYDSHRDEFRYQDCELNHVPKERSRRSHSSPPFYRSKRRFISLNLCPMTKVAKPEAKTFKDALTSPGFVFYMNFPVRPCAMAQNSNMTVIHAEDGELKHLQQSSADRRPYYKPSFVEDLLFHTRPDMMTKPKITLDTNDIHECEKFRQCQCFRPHNITPVEDFTSKGIQDSINSGAKWQSSHPQNANTYRSHDNHDQDDILDITSGFLHLAGDSLIPESISKNCLEDAKVLQQVDKKFIPVVAGGTLAIIDQHAADERIRLEELRQKVLSGEAKTVTYLEAEQELILPETGYQLLHNYAERIKDWGWICNIHAQGSRSFKNNLKLLHRRPTVVTLLAVPCILGVNLSDVDLFEFLQQLADTDGSSTVPPSVLRVLNFKACRGAIMFGDSLLPSECSLIVEELKQTSLCFQCAHGRPTTAPLVNLEALHKQIDKLRVLNDGSSQLWHGLHRHELSLERAARRLSAAKD